MTTSPPHSSATTSPPSNPDPTTVPPTDVAEEDEASLLATSAALKTSANALFATAAYSDAIPLYARALAACPHDLDYETAVLHANIAACHLKLGEWGEAVEEATKAIERLDFGEGSPPGNAEGVEGKEGAGEVDGAEAEGSPRVQELSPENAARLEALSARGHTHTAVQKLRAKALLRRATARSSLGGWSSLQGASEDYATLLQIPELGTLDRRTVEAAQRTLPGRLETAKQAEMGEMMGKLKQLGNGILRPFGMSTDNFGFVKDEKTGGYSMQFNQGGK